MTVIADVRGMACEAGDGRIQMLPRLLQSLQNFKFQSLKFNHAKVQTVTNPGEIHGNGKTTMNSTRTQRLFFDRFEIHASFKRPVPLQFL
jgi:hypothetical protein